MSPLLDLDDRPRRFRELDRDDASKRTAWENTEDEVAEWLFRTLGSLDQRDAIRSVYLTNQPFHVLFDVITKLTTQFIKDDLPEIIEAFELLAGFDRDELLGYEFGDRVEGPWVAQWDERRLRLLSKVS